MSSSKRIWGDKPGHQYQWDQALTEIFGLVAQHQNSIAAALRVGEGKWAPLIDVYEVDGKQLSFGQEWALGFMRGVELRFAQWAPLGKDPAHSPGWRAIGTLALGRNHPASGKRVRTQAQRDRLIDKMLDFVEHAAGYWLERDGRAATVY
jgi:uncharacterized protein